jgi:hypothetical protein
MLNRLSQYLHISNILAPKQLAFRKGKCCPQLNSVFKSLNQKRHVAGIFCNLAKVFDCVDHEIWLAKSHFYCIQGTDANWFRSHLTDERRKKAETKPSSDACNFFSD